jgi:predicted RNA-binding protein (TIGR00451 family)
MSEIKIKARHLLSKKEKKAVKALMAKMGVNIDTSGSIEKARIDVGGLKNLEVLIVNGRPVLLFREESVEPLLCYMVRSRDTLGYPKVIVDRGASAAVARGANLMLPGIRGVEGSFNEGDIVVIVDEESGIPVAVGKALLPSSVILESIKGKHKGVAVKVLQRPGDRLWSLCDSI